DASSSVLDPFAAAPTLSLLCEIVDPVTREPYAKDPRRIAKRAEEYLRETGVADTAYIGPECEFFVLDTVSYELADHKAHYEIDSEEGHWNSGNPGLGYTVRPKEGYFPPAPHDTLADLRSEMVLTLERLGIPCEFHHHEVASGGQCEIDLRYGTLTRMADQVMTYKYVVKNVARAAGKTVTFMPKPLFGDNGSGKPLPRLLGDADGGSGRNRKGLGRRGAGRLGPLRGGPRCRAGAWLPRRGPGRARSRPRVLARRRRLQRGADSHLDRLQTGERGRRCAAAAAPGRVRPL